MPNIRKDGYSRVVSALHFFSTLARTKAKTKVKTILSVVTTLVIAITCSAQNQDQAQTPTQVSQINASPTASANSANTFVPAGTRFALVLTNPLSSKQIHRGDEVYTQTTAPVLVGNQVVIPAGIFIQGKIDKLTRNGSRAQLQLSSASIVFPDGYVANITGPLDAESDEGTAWRDPSSAARAGAIIAPMAGAGLGAAIGSAAHTTNSSTLGGTTITSSSPKGIMIGSAVGVAAGLTISLAILLHSRHFFVDVGSPMEMTLPQSVTLPEDQIARAARDVQEHPIAVPMPAPRPFPYPSYNHGTCYTAGSPGTPPTVIPGTPPIGDSPGTPATVIPGTPAISGTPYPCP